MTKHMYAISFHLRTARLLFALMASFLAALILPPLLFAQTATTSTATGTSTATTMAATTTNTNTNTGATYVPTTGPVMTTGTTGATPPVSSVVVTTTTSAQGASGQMISRELSLGASGSDVFLLQQFLARDPLVYPEGLVTGYFGGLTGEAVKRYQSKNGLPAVGRVGPQTLSLINMNIASGGTSGTSVGGGVMQSGDSISPVISSHTAATTRTTATLSWTTNEPSRGYVFYGTEWPYVSVHSLSPAANLYNTAQLTTIGGLIPGERYYYKIAAVDSSGNVTVSAVPLSVDTAP